MKFKKKMIEYEKEKLHSSIVDLINRKIHSNHNIFLSWLYRFGNLASIGMIFNSSVDHTFSCMPYIPCICSKALDLYLQNLTILKVRE